MDDTTVGVLFVVAIGAIVVVPIVIFALFLRRLKGKRIRIDDPIPGVIEVVDTSRPSTRGIYQDFYLTGVLRVEGMPAQPVNYKGTVETAKHPAAGMQLPVTASRSEPNKFRIEWEQIPTAAQRAQLEAQQRANALNTDSSR